jgi:hypothetical protein
VHVFVLGQSVSCKIKITHFIDDCMLRSLKELVHGVNVWDAGLSVTKIHMGVYSEDIRLLQAVTQVCLAQALYIYVYH